MPRPGARAGHGHPVGEPGLARPLGRTPSRRRGSGRCCRCTRRPRGTWRRWSPTAGAGRRAVRWRVPRWCEAERQRSPPRLPPGRTSLVVTPVPVPPGDGRPPGVRLSRLPPGRTRPVSCGENPAARRGGSDGVSRSVAGGATTTPGVVLPRALLVAADGASPVRSEGESPVLTRRDAHLERDALSRCGTRPCRNARLTRTHRRRPSREDGRGRAGVRVGLRVRRRCRTGSRWRPRSRRSWRCRWGRWRSSRCRRSACPGR